MGIINGLKDIYYFLCFMCGEDSLRKFFHEAIITGTILAAFNFYLTLSKDPVNHKRVADELRKELETYDSNPKR